MLERLEELEKRQLKKWNSDRHVLICQIRRSLSGTTDNVVNIRRSSPGQFAAKTSNNPVEQEFALRATNKGWTVSKRGWPDFFMWKDGKLACVEVKRDLSPLRANQKAVLEALASYGVPCFTWRPLEGFRRITGKEVSESVRVAKRSS
jgi:hypothetical protein